MSTSAGSPAMLREIYEQPAAIAATIERHTHDGKVFPNELRAVDGALLAFDKVVVVASGSSRHAGLAGEIMIEDLSGIPVDVEYASEYCFRSTHAGADPIVLAITQSGETADTVAALREARSCGAQTISICNVANSTIARESHVNLLTEAGMETAVPATKSFTTQVTVLYLLALLLARKRGRMTAELLRQRLNSLAEIPQSIEKWLPGWEEQTAECARRFHSAASFLYLGRGVHYAIAREGALKLKEISYAHAEGYPTGEILHGPQALVNEKFPIVALATYDASDVDSVLRYEHSLPILKKARENGGRVIAIANDGDELLGQCADAVIHVPPAQELLLPILEVVPLQLFAYHVAVANGLNVDRPRHLVKSVRE